MTPHFRLFRMKARHWKWGRHFITALFCFAFGVGIAGDVKWLRNEPEMEAVDIEDYGTILKYDGTNETLSFLVDDGDQKDLAFVAPGEVGQCLRSSGSGFAWGDCTGGGSGSVTSVLASDISSGTITATALATTATTLLPASDQPGIWRNQSVNG